MADSIFDIKKILNDYSEEIQEGIVELAISIAKEGQKELKSTSPVSKKKTKYQGRYAKSWSVSTTRGRGFVNCKIYNKTDYQLTHLLENEHLSGHGAKYVPKKKHIEPVDDFCCKKFETEVEKLIQNGG